MTTWSYYKITGWDGDEMRAIMRSETEDYVSEEIQAINRDLDNENWNIRIITQAEFETYQAFGIKEIKM